MVPLISPTACRCIQVSRANRRYYRTIILGVFAMSSLIWVAIDQFDIPVEDMLSLFYATAIGAGGIILAAAIFVFLMAGLRKLSGRDRH